MDETLKTRGIIYLNVEAWLLSAPHYQNFWLRAWLKLELIVMVWSLKDNNVVEHLFQSGLPCDLDWFHEVQEPPDNYADVQALWPNLCCSKKMRFCLP